MFHKVFLRGKDRFTLAKKRMRNSLRQLLARPVERIVFAHGTPILSGASARLQELLGPK